MSEYYNPEVQQSYPDSCAIKSQQLILNDFGIEVSEVDLVQTAAVNGWYNGGTAPQDVGNLLELANIPVTRHEGANVFNLVNELVQGHKVIVGVDANEMWYNESENDKFINWYNDFCGMQGGNHALIVAGIDTSDVASPQVVVVDPGTGDDGKRYPLDQFIDAWSDSNCYMVSTDIPAPNFSRGMQNFDQELGHISKIFGVDYYEYQLFNDISMGLTKSMSGNNISPMESLTNAFFDYANNDADFYDIFSDKYLFNNYLDNSVIKECMRSTCYDGFNDIKWSDLNIMNHDIPDDFNRFMLADMNVDYNTFYNECINQFSNINDFNSMMLCQQQLSILNYCECNDIDYSVDFLMYV